MSEVNFCGHCPREQQTSQGEKCISCKRTTITWDKSKNPTLEWAEKQWKEMRKYYGDS
jgi:hypothetical protein